MAETKQCPDCAEHVLVLARKCRYCGYRFDQRRREPASALERLLGARRKDIREASLPEVLADWGVLLDDGEAAPFFHLAELDDQRGYLLVTRTRLVFFARRGKSMHDKLIEYPLSQIAQTRVLGHRGRRRVEFSGDAFTHLVRTDTKRNTRLLAECLMETSSG